MVAAEVRPACVADLESAKALLAANGLPLDGFPETARHIWVATDHGEVVGVVALELYPPAALLRSLAVRDDMRGQHLGRRLVAVALDDARLRDLAVVYLLTTTAESFFQHLGFTIVSRDDVPDSVLDSVEFRSACPSTAAAMILRVNT